MWSLLRFIFLLNTFFSFPKEAIIFPYWNPIQYFPSWFVSKIISDGCLFPGGEVDVFFTSLWSEFSQSQVFSVIIHSQGRTMNLLLVVSQQKMSVAVLYLYSLKCSVMVRCLSPLRLGREDMPSASSPWTHSSKDRHKLVGETSEKLPGSSPCGSREFEGETALVIRKQQLI